MGDKIGNLKLNQNFYFLLNEIVGPLANNTKHKQITYNILYRNTQGPSWPWSYGRWIYNYLCNQCISPLMLWVWISFRARCKTLCDKVCQWLVTGWWFAPGLPVSSIIYNWPPWYNWNIVDSGIKHNQTNIYKYTEMVVNVRVIAEKQTQA